MKRPPKDTISKNIMLFLGHQDEATLTEISNQIDLQEELTKQLLANLIDKGYVGINNGKYYPNFLYNQNK
jgi:DNA-binding IscR family transcriptional regulator